jgi:hypothetical protein
MASHPLIGCGGVGGAAVVADASGMELFQGVTVNDGYSSAALYAIF